MSPAQAVGYYAFEAIAVLVVVVVFGCLALVFAGWVMDTFARLFGGTVEATTEPAAHGRAAGTWKRCGR